MRHDSGHAQRSASSQLGQRSVGSGTQVLTEPTGVANIAVAGQRHFDVLAPHFKHVPASVRALSGGGNERWVTPPPSSRYTGCVKVKVSSKGLTYRHP